MELAAISPKASTSILIRKKLSDEECLSASLIHIQQIFNVCKFYSDFKIDSEDSADTGSFKFSKTLSYSQMKKKQLVDKSISLYKKTKESYKHRKMSSLSAIVTSKNAEKCECKEESLGYFNAAKKLYQNYVPSFSPATFIISHIPSKYLISNDTKLIEKTELKYKDRSSLTDQEVTNVFLFLKELSKIEVDNQAVGTQMKLFLKEWDKYYIKHMISSKTHTDRRISLNDMTPLELMVNMEMWNQRYMNFINSTINYVTSVAAKSNLELVDTELTRFDSSNFENNTSIYSGDTTIPHATRPLASYKINGQSSSASTIFTSTRLGEVNSFMDDSTLFDNLDIDLSSFEFDDFNERCTSPISEKIDLLFPIQNEKTIIEQINTHNHDHCMDTIAKRTLHYYELPFPYRENKFIINGYRYYDFYDSLKSVFALIPVLAKPTYNDIVGGNEIKDSKFHHVYHWHNETVNIWTHLLASFYFLYKVLTFKFVYNTTAQNASISAFFLMSFCCFIFSSSWHTLSGWNKLKRRSKACCLDYSGISMLIVSSIIAIQCSIVPQDNKKVLELYAWILLTLSLLIMSLVLNWHPKFDSPESRNIRILVFVSMAAVGNLSIIALNPAKKGFHFLTLFKSSFVWYLLGVVFYGGFLPERFRSDCPIGRIPTMIERNSELKLIKEERNVYFKTTPYLSKYVKEVSIKVEQCAEEIMNEIDDDICEEIDKSSHSWKSLWWTDYYLQSHNIWHIMVIMGCLGHFRAVELILENME
ncbi:hypothetical protein QEN19_001577 [Hanseniaspora menglaensis]